MPVPTLITDLSTTAGSNSPAGGETPADGDNHIRALAAFIASIMANSGNGWTSPYATPAALAAYLPLAGGTVAGNLSVTGNTTLGDAAGDTVTITGTPAGQVVSGTYTPTLTAVVNVSGLTSNQAQWMRVGSVVTVAGIFAGTQTSVATNCRAGISLPVASNFTVAAHCGGGGGMLPTSGNVQGLYVVADATNDRAEVLWIASGSSVAFNASYTFTYVIA